MSPYYIDSIFFDGNYLKVVIKDANKESWSVELDLTADDLLRIKGL